jgi:hypothetical protein
VGIGLIATIRPDSWNFPLLVHAFGALLLVGGLVTGGTALVYGWRDATARLLRLGYFTLLAVALPGYIVMRVGAEWIFNKEGWDDVDDEPAWLGIGYITADGGALLLLIALIVGGIGVRRLRNGGGAGLLKASTVLALVALAAYVVAVWAMAGKPG